MSAAGSARGVEAAETVELLAGRIAQLEALLAQRATASPDGLAADVVGARSAERKPKGGPIDEEMRNVLFAKRERLELARLAEQGAWNDLKAAVCDAAASGVSYREIGDTIGVTRARVYQIVSGKR